MGRGGGGFLTTTHRVPCSAEHPGQRVYDSNTVSRYLGWVVPGMGRGPCSTGLQGGAVGCPGGTGDWRQVSAGVRTAGHQEGPLG